MASVVPLIDLDMAPIPVSEGRAKASIASLFSLAMPAIAVRACPIQFCEEGYSLYGTT